MIKLPSLDGVYRATYNLAMEVWADEENELEQGLVFYKGNGMSQCRAINYWEGDVFSESKPFEDCQLQTP